MAQDSCKDKGVSIQAKRPRGSAGVPAAVVEGYRPRLWSSDISFDWHVRQSR
jgi:hypothetical protein